MVSGRGTAETESLKSKKEEVGGGDTQSLAFFLTKIEMNSKIWIDSNPDSLEEYFQEHTLMLFRPCLGQPCFVRANKFDEGFKIVVVSNTNDDKVIRQKLGNSLILSKVGDEETKHPLVVEKPIELLCAYKNGSLDVPDCMAHRLDIPGWHLFSTKIYKPTVWFFEVTLTFEQQPVIPDKQAIELYNLDRLSSEEDIVERKCHAVCLTNKREWEIFNFIHTTDLHVAKRNDQIFDMILESKSNQKERDNFTKRYVNFNDHLRYLIKQANQLAEKGELDFILMTGDLIDYINPSLGDADQTNWKFFHDILTGNATTTNRPEVPLQVPIFTVLGNHDFRLNHYRLGDGGDRWKEYGLTKKEFKQFDKKEPNIKFPRQLKANLFGIADYLVNFNPDLEYAVNLGAHRMLCLDSGEDEFTAASAEKLIIGGVKRAFTEGLRSALTYYLMRYQDIGDALGGVIGGGPKSAGLFSKQVDWASRVLDESNSGLTFAAMHSPPVNKPPQVHFEEYRESLRERAGKTGWIHTDEVDLSGASISRHWQRFLNFLVGINDYKKGVNLVLCGHTHCDLAFRLEKYAAIEGRPTRFPQKHKVAIYTDKYAQDLDKARNCEDWWQEHQPLILQTPSLGPEGGDKSPQGYRLVQVANNTITKLDYCSLRNEDK